MYPSSELSLQTLVGSQVNVTISFKAHKVKKKMFIPYANLEKNIGVISIHVCKQPMEGVWLGVHSVCL